MEGESKVKMGLFQIGEEGESLSPLDPSPLNIHSWYIIFHNLVCVVDTVSSNLGLCCLIQLTF